MNRKWMIGILLLTIGLLSAIKSHEVSALALFFKSERTVKLPHFQSAKERIDSHKLPMLELWESILTGRVAPLDRWLREEYRVLTLAHLFTPSGFHLSALLWPLLFVFKRKRHKVFLLSSIGILLSFLPGQGALKRMTAIKLSQQFLGIKFGFCLALILDVFWGSFNQSPLGFTYSFLFLGIIYSGARGLTLIIWFYLAQIIITYFSSGLISPLLVITSPLINSLFSIVLPLLFLFSFPLWDWQLNLGIFILENIQRIVSLAFHLVNALPLLEVNLGLIAFVTLVLVRKIKLASVVLFFTCLNLNSDFSKTPGLGSYEWRANGVVLKAKENKIYKTDGICKRNLVRGMWYETCSPRRKSRHKKT